MYRTNLLILSMASRARGQVNVTREHEESCGVREGILVRHRFAMKDIRGDLGVDYKTAMVQFYYVATRYHAAEI